MAQKVNADSLFVVARQYSFDGEYQKALQTTDEILLHHPDYYDATLLKCRIYSWQGDYEKAETIANDILKETPKNYDAYEALSNIYFWNNQNEKCILTLNKALYFFEDDILFLSKKVKALLALKNFDEAQNVLAILLDLDPENPDIKKLSERVSLESTQLTPINVDSIFIQANKLAQKKDYVVARKKAEHILKLVPSYTDANILIARTYAWSGDYDTALKELSNISETYEAISLKAEIYFWNKQYTSCLETLNNALLSYPKDIPLLTQKFKVQSALKDNASAKETLLQIETLSPNNEMVATEKKKIALNSPYQQIIKVRYDYETFTEPWKRMWTLTGFSYGRRTEKHGDYYANIFMGDLILPGESYGKDLGLQFELECYPKIDELNSLFLAYAYSPSSIFSTHRIGAEYYRSFPDIIDVSLGYRYMNFSNDVETPVNVNVFTASVNKYLGDYWLSFRPYAVLVSNVDKINSSYQLIGRKYLERPESFIGLTLGYGVSSPDDSFFQNNAGRIPLFKTYTAQTQFKYRLTPHIILDSLLGYENAAYEEGKNRGQLNFSITVSCLLY